MEFGFFGFVLTTTVIGKQRGRFKRTFEGAQHQLRTKFGMEMVELPVREKVTMKERRGWINHLYHLSCSNVHLAAQKSKGGATTTATYILTSVLPVKFRGPDIMPPSKIGDQVEEAAYTGLYTFIITIIALSPQGAITEGKLKMSLERVSARDYTPLDKTDLVLAKMIKQGYITKTVERTEQDETIEYRVGARGKIEVGNKGIQGLVREVYGDSAPDDLDTRLRRSLGIEIAEDMDVDEEEEGQEQSQVSVEPGPSRTSGRRR